MNLTTRRIALYSLNKLDGMRLEVGYRIRNVFLLYLRVVLVHRASPSLFSGAIASWVSIR